MFDRLSTLGATYGDLPAHDGLWEVAQETSHDLLARLAVVPLVFAFICGFLTYFQRLSLKSGVAPRGKERIRLHGIFMGAGTISTVTAFSLTAVGGGVVMWLLPTAIGTPLIVWNLGGLRTGRVQVPVNTDAA